MRTHTHTKQLPLSPSSLAPIFSLVPIVRAEAGSYLGATGSVTTSFLGVASSRSRKSVSGSASFRGVARCGAGFLGVLSLDELLLKFSARSCSFKSNDPCGWAGALCSGAEPAAPCIRSETVGGWMVAAGKTEWLFQYECLTYVSRLPKSSRSATSCSRTFWVLTAWFRRETNYVGDGVEIVPKSQKWNLIFDYEAPKNFLLRVPLISYLSFHWKSSFSLQSDKVL